MVPTLDHPNLGVCVSRLVRGTFRPEESLEPSPTEDLDPSVRRRCRSVGSWVGSGRLSDPTCHGCLSGRRGNPSTVGPRRRTQTESVLVLEKNRRRSKRTTGVRPTPSRDWGSDVDSTVPEFPGRPDSPSLPSSRDNRGLRLLGGHQTETDLQHVFLVAYD